MLLALSCVALPWSCLASNLHFVFDPLRSFTDGTTKITFHSQGSFSGSFDPLKNPLGTQTKLESGSFGLVENDRVRAMPFVQLERKAVVRTTGSFDLKIDSALKNAELSAYETSRVPEQGQLLSATVALNNEAFRTQRPTGNYRANIPPLQLGLVNLDKFGMKQDPGYRLSGLVPLGHSRYGAVFTFMAEAQLDVKEFGQTVPIRFRTPASLVGVLDLGVAPPTFGYSLGVGGDTFSRDVEIPLQPFPFFMSSETVVPATFVMSTTITRITVQVTGTRQMLATAR